MSITEKSVILLTGKPNVGKTTAIDWIRLQLGNQAAGYYTQEVRNQAGGRVGFNVVLLGKNIEVPLSKRGHEQFFPEQLTFENYKVSLEAIESVCVQAITDAAASGKVVIIDEIGPKTMLSDSFCEAVEELLNGEALVVGTIVSPDHPTAKYYRNHFRAEQFRNHSRVKVLAVTNNNRNDLPREVLTELRLLQKRAKAKKYAAQPGRFEELEIKLSMNSDHGVRSVRYTNGIWNCDCDFYQTEKTCSHIMATQEVLKTL